MKKLITTALILIALHFTSKAQNYIYKGDKKYLSTNTWQFGTFGGLEVTIAKHSNGAYLMLSKSVPFKEYAIKGVVTVFLADGTILKCTDKGIRDHLDGKCISLYNFTKSEIELLKQERIVRIRYSLYKPGMGLENFTADNERGIYSSRLLLDTNTPERKNYYDTDIAVSELFDNQ